MILALLVTPLAAALAAFALRSDGPRRLLLLVAAILQAVWTAAAWAAPRSPAPGSWLGLDSAGLLFLSITNLLFLAAAGYACGYLRAEARRRKLDPEEGFLFANYPEATFTGCLLLFQATMNLVALSRHLGLLWVAVEATTLSSAPLIFFHRHHRSLEATWKYLLLCSVGIAIALLGNFFLTVAASAPGGPPPAMTVDGLAALSGGLDPSWLRAAFLLFLVGYGTKMGLAPLHNWLPDAHSEAPSVVSALLSGALLNCAFLAILRVHSILDSAGIGGFSRDLLVIFGLLSLGVAAVFIIGQTDFKRMLAYSSVEHMGILALGAGIGGLAGYGGLFHALNHSLAKAMLFLTAGNIIAACRTKSISEAGGLGRAIPLTAVLWMIGFLAITGSPPFALFASELAILLGIIAAGRVWVAVFYLLMLAAVFIGMAGIFIRMIYGPAPAGRENPSPEAAWSVWIPAVLAGFLLVLGLYSPPGLTRVLREAAVVLGVSG